MNTPNAQILVFKHYSHQVESWALEEMTNTRAGPGKKKKARWTQKVLRAQRREKYQKDTEGHLKGLLQFKPGMIWTLKWIVITYYDFFE